MSARPGDRWRAALAARAVPQTILDNAPEPPSGLEPEMFRWRPEEDAEQPARPSRRRALEALPDGGSVLDVGVGGGASSLGLAPRVATITGVDSSQGMLDLFQTSAREAGVAPRTVIGTWPEIAPAVEPADIAVSHHALYNAAEIEDSLLALTARARHRVVIEVSAQLPLARLDPLWKAFHGTERPDCRVADELCAVLAALGLAVEREDVALPARSPNVSAEMVAFLRRRLYVGSDRDPEIEEYLQGLQPVPHTVVALWWPGAA
ncbi:MAG: class I SAM-dependent methyltransferase [Actinomycetota bacterium]|nr:class I SAM-dependent methyltransferase [Actinomycetota bacterium]